MFGVSRFQAWGPILGVLFGILAGSTLALPNDERGSELRRSLGDPHELWRKLTAQKLDLYYVEHWSGTIYLTEQPWPLPELLTRMTYRGLAAEWKGTVRISKIHEDTCDSSNYGDFGFIAGNCLVFGDPELVRQIRATLRKD